MEILNRKAKYEYFILETYECGIELKGTEVKSIRKGSCNIKDSYGNIKNGEVYLINMFIAHYKEGNIFNHEEARTRKLLLHRKEINKITKQIEQEGLTLIPLKLYFKHGKVKVLLGVAQGKKLHDKRNTLKESDAKRQIEKATKHRI